MPAFGGLELNFKEAKTDVVLQLKGRGKATAQRQLRSHEGALWLEIEEGWSVRVVDQYTGQADALLHAS